MDQGYHRLTQRLSLIEGAGILPYIAFFVGVADSPAGHHHPVDDKEIVEGGEGIAAAGMPAHDDDAADFVSELCVGGPEDEGAVDYRFGLGGHVPEVYWRAEDDAIGLQKLVV